LSDFPIRAGSIGGLPEIHQGHTTALAMLLLKKASRIVVPTV
jgi:hypothetical protein